VRAPRALVDAEIGEAPRNEEPGVIAGEEEGRSAGRALDQERPRLVVFEECGSRSTPRQRRLAYGCSA
jgi:hypothetical protein